MWSFTLKHGADYRIWAFASKIEALKAHVLVVRRNLNVEEVRIRRIKSYYKTDTFDDFKKWVQSQ